MTTAAAPRPKEQRARSTGWAEARRLAHDLPSPLPAEEVPLASAAGRALAAPLRAEVPSPGFDNAAMDGYAVRGPGPWRVVARVLAGHTHVPPPLAAQTAVEVATGAPVPEGTERVVPYETAERRGDTVWAPPGDRPHVRRRGEYARRGQELLPAGSAITAPALGLAASVGLDTLTVRARPRVRMVVSGNELVAAGPPRWGQVRDAIGPMLPPLLTSWRAELLDSRMVGDEPDWFAAAVADSTSDADVTIVCGASSVGPADGLHDALHDLRATVHIDGVACRPGHPQVLAQVGQKWIVGLPGNPYAALVAALTLVEPLLAGLTGLPLTELETGTLVGAPPADERHTRILPVRRSAQVLHVVEGGQSGQLSGAAGADAFAVVPTGWRGTAPVGLLRLGR
ncbi:molybdopterin molybdotransferase MoeA [Micromonospora sp. NPDC048930]|uniref:molybdopterin molybdotransferase MoeA n=1 Tax=Micromonospora sp. NPDC048930 TaxID=3364261 RepID=UPI00371BA630